MHPFFSVDFYRGFAPSSVSIFSRRKVPDVNVLFSISGFYVYRSQPFLFAVVETHAFIARFVIFLSATISVILRRRSVAQIFPSVVRLVFISVIDFVFRPFASHVQPRKAMGHILMAVDSDFDSAFFLFGTGGFACGISLGQCDYPSKNSGQRIVVQNRFEIFLRQIAQRIFVASCHVLLLIPGAVYVKGVFNAP